MSDKKQWQYRKVVTETSVLCITVVLFLVHSAVDIPLSVQISIPWTINSHISGSWGYALHVRVRDIRTFWDIVSTPEHPWHDSHEHEPVEPELGGIPPRPGGFTVLMWLLWRVGYSGWGGRERLEGYSCGLRRLFCERGFEDVEGEERHPSAKAVRSNVSSCWSSTSPEEICGRPLSRLLKGRSDCNMCGLVLFRRSQNCVVEWVCHTDYKILAFIHPLSINRHHT